MGLWLLSGLGTTSLPFDCERGFGNWEALWSMEQQDFCCTTVGRGCTTRPTTARPQTLPVTVPPTPFPTPAPTPPPTVRPIRPVPTGDPFNCAVDAESSWAPEKRSWCCRVHHKGCPTQMPTAAPIIVPVLPPQPVRPADPYNCADGFANWEAGWSVGKKSLVLQSAWKGLPTSSRWLWDHVFALRLQRWLCKLDGRLECGQESLVLQSWRKGVPARCWWLRLRWDRMPCQQLMNW